ncbi:MAG: orotidine-5'-phosphate decarboxylase [Synechococcales cyanobacterium K44_A2020_017]|nr:orotidine-5'-phosphate decarboxylase [Synechococcales cyanobacterium K32_A2020_035]MBF2093125.1 orotidine-5'-phosphate decarboxylase [Synechococcales cyanobacterium K44_A2020_017]
MTLSPQERVIVALDVSTEQEAIAWLDRLPDVTFWKVGLELFVSCGPAILAELKARQKRIFLDLKFHDIPNTMAGACRAAGRYGVDLMTVHAPAGKVALEQAVQAAQEGAIAAGYPAPQLLAVTVLTSIDSRTLAFELKVPLELPDYVLQLTLLAQSAGISGIVCSPQEVEPLRRSLGQEVLLVCPGVRPTWAIAGDQRRVFTPEATVQAGADYLVIGRPITAAEDPVAAFQRICDDLR